MVKKRAVKLKWADLISAAEAKISKNRLKNAQLEALILTMKAQAEAGEKPPYDLSLIGKDLNELLQ